MYQLPSSLSLSSLSYACARNLRPPRGAPDDTRGGVRIAGGETSQSTHRWRAYGRKKTGGRLFPRRLLIAILQ